MKISDAILKLQQIQAAHGDLPVLTQDVEIGEFFEATISHQNTTTIYNGDEDPSSFPIAGDFVYIS